MSSSALFDFFRDRRFDDEDPETCAFFLLRLDFRLDEAECAFSEGGMDGPAADSGLDIVGACFPFLFLREYAGCGGGAGAAAGWGGCWSETFALLERLVEGAGSGAISKSAVTLRFRGSDRRGAGGGGAGSAGDPAAEAPADRDDSACLAAWRADERVAGLVVFGEEEQRDRVLMAPNATGGAPAPVVGAVLVVDVVAGCVFAIARGLGLRFGLEVEFGGGISVAAEAGMGGKEVEVAVEADEVGSVLLDEREFQLVVLRSAMDYAAIGIGDNKFTGKVG